MSTDMSDRDSKNFASTKPTNLAEALAAAPRKPRSSMRAYVRENRIVLRHARDEGVEWNEIVNLIAEDLKVHKVDRKTIETYLAREFPAKEARGERESKGSTEQSRSEPQSRDLGIQRPYVDLNKLAATRSAGKPSGTATQTPSSAPNGSNPFMPKRPMPKGEA